MVHYCWNGGSSLLEFGWYMAGFMVQDGWNLQLHILVKFTTYPEIDEPAFQIS